jgi:hypothetical protein
MKTVWLLLGVATLFAQPVLAKSARNQQTQSGTSQTTSSQEAAPQTSQMPVQQNESSQMPAQQDESLKQQLKANLMKSGFTNVQILPQSFLIRAKDPQGNPIAMAVTPDTVTAVEFGGATGNMMSGRSVGQSEPKFISGGIRDVAEANITNTRVRSSDNKNIGTIAKIVVGDNGQLSYLIVMDNGREVAINPDAMRLSYNDSDDSWNASVDATKNQIDSAPPAQVQ